MTFSLVSCKKDLDTAGANLVGVRNGFGTVFDTTINLNVYTVPMDSIASSNLSSYALGKINDPLLGTSRADIVLQYGLPSNLFSWGGAPNLDSVVLQLQYRDYQSQFGDSNQVHTIKVYELTEDLSYDSVYYSQRKYASNKVEVGSWTGVFDLLDSSTITLGTSTTYTLLPHLRIKMNQAFVNKLFSGESNNYFTDNPTFLTNYKGLVVVDETNLGAGNVGSIVCFLTNSVVSNTALVAYHDSIASSFPIIPQNEVVYNYYEQSNVPLNVLQYGFHQNHRDTGFVQPLSGTKLRIEIPQLFDFFKNPKTVLNGAEIVFSVMDGSDGGFFQLPNQLLLVGSDSLGRNTFLRDQVYEASSFYGGTYNSSYRQYRFNIVRQIQYYLDNYWKGSNVNYGMHLIVPSDNPVTASRVIFDTRKNNGKIRLKLTYTTVKK